MMTFWYRVCWWLCRIGLFFWHPVFHVVGRELVPAGKAVLSVNHSGCADAIWLLLALDAPQMCRIIAKKELRSVPIVGWVMEKFRIIFVDRAAHDGTAYHEGVKALENDEKMMVFVEGTRCNGKKHVRAEDGCGPDGSRGSRAGRAGVYYAQQNAVVSDQRHFRRAILCGKAR